MLTIIAECYQLIVCVALCVCVCVRAQEERKRGDRGRLSLMKPSLLTAGQLTKHASQTTEKRPAVPLETHNDTASQSHRGRWPELDHAPSEALSE